MLGELLEQGRTYREVATGLGVCHTTVERQIKALLWSVARRSPIPGVPDLDLASLAQLRLHADAVMAAVRVAPVHDEAPPLVDLDEAELLGGIRRIRRLSENANRDVALVLTLLCTGAKPLEIARLKVRDYVDEDGSARRESCLPEGTALHGRERPIYFDSDRTCQAIDAYLEERVRRQIGVNARASFRGLDPESALFLTAKGQPFRIRARSTSDQRPSCPVLLETYSGIFRRAGWRGVTTQYARRLFAQRLAGKGADREQLAELLGVATDRSVKRLLERRQQPLSDLVKDLV
jgi:integrase